jgi:hypothetical protein
MTSPETYSALRGQLFSSIVVPEFTDEIRTGINRVQLLERGAAVIEAAAHGLVCVASVLAFAAGFYDDKNLSFVAACSSTLSLALLRYVNYAREAAESKATSINRMLDRAGIEPLFDSQHGHSHGTTITGGGAPVEISV